MTMELGPNQTRWLEALESGAYDQARNLLHEPLTNNYCCLGVACSIFLGQPTERKTDAFGEVRDFWDDEFAVAPPSLQEKLALRDDSGSRLDYNINLSLTAMNDEGSTFKKIAATVRAEPEQYFQEPR